MLSVTVIISSAQNAMTMTQKLHLFLKLAVTAASMQLARLAVVLWHGALYCMAGNCHWPCWVSRVPAAIMNVANCTAWMTDQIPGGCGGGLPVTWYCDVTYATVLLTKQWFVSQIICMCQYCSLFVISMLWSCFCIQTEALLVIVYCHEYHINKLSYLLRERERIYLPSINKHTMYIK